MKQLRSFRRRFSLHLSQSTLRSFYTGILGLVLMLCAPLLEPTHEVQVAPRPAPETPDPEQRFGVKLRHGDTLLSVLARFGLKAPSAHAMIEQVRPFLNPKKFAPATTFRWSSVKRIEPCRRWSWSSTTAWCG